MSKKVFVSDKTFMILESLNNISTDHKLYKTFYEKEVGDDCHVNVYGNAKIYSKALVYGDAQVFGNALVFHDAVVYGNAKVYGLAVVSGNARVYGNAEVFGRAQIFSNAKVFENAKVFGYAEVYGNVYVYGNAEISGGANVYVNAIVCGDAKVTKDTVNIVGLPYDITLTDNHIQMGSKQFTFDFFKKIYDIDINLLGEYFNKMFKYKDMLLELIKTREKENDKERIL